MLSLLVLASDKVAGGLLATDDIGVVSLLLFWGMIEIGAGMIAVCLPALRPLLGERYLESMKKSIRFTLSLRSLLDDGINRIKGRQLASEPSLNEISREYIHHAKMEEGDMLAK